MNASKEREYVKQVYPHPTWRKKVDEMADVQVVAIYLRLKRMESDIRPEPENPDQLRLF